MTKVARGTAALAAAAATSLRPPCRRQTLYLTAVLAITGLGLLTNSSQPVEHPLATHGGEHRATAIDDSRTTASLPLPPDERETCWCHRRHLTLLETAPELRNTACSPAAFARGPGQKVIGFTYYEVNSSSSMEEERGYFRGITENLELIR